MLAFAAAAKLQSVSLEDALALSLLLASARDLRGANKRRDAAKNVRHQVRRLPVVDQNRLVGIVAQADVAQEAKAKQVGEVLEEISKPTGVGS